MSQRNTRYASSTSRVSGPCRNLTCYYSFLPGCFLKGSLYLTSSIKKTNLPVITSTNLYKHRRSKKHSHGEILSGTFSHRHHFLPGFTRFHTRFPPFWSAPNELWKCCWSRSRSAHGDWGKPAFVLKDFVLVFGGAGWYHTTLRDSCPFKRTWQMALARNSPKVSSLQVLVFANGF